MVSKRYFLNVVSGWYWYCTGTRVGIGTGTRTGTRTRTEYARPSTTVVVKRR